VIPLSLFWLEQHLWEQVLGGGLGFVGGLIVRRDGALILRIMARLVNNPLIIEFRKRIKII